jgi:hypothetical protein
LFFRYQYILNRLVTGINYPTQYFQWFGAFSAAVDFSLAEIEPPLVISIFLKPAPESLV